MSRRDKKGMVLLATIAIVSLVAILAVATLSLSARVEQGAALNLRDAELDAAAAFGVGSVAGEWRARSIGQIGVGSTLDFDVAIPGVPIPVGVGVTRVSQEAFWVVATARAPDGSMRRENLILRVRMPDAELVVAEDSSVVATIGMVATGSLAASADVTLPGGTVGPAIDGVVHALGDLTVEGGSASGILVVDGRLSITGPLTYSGLIIVRGGIAVSASSAHVTGAMRMGGESISLGMLTIERDAAAVQAVLSKSLTPKPVAGRRWAEMY